MIVTIQFFKKDGTYMCTENIDIVYNDRTELIKELKKLKRKSFKDYSMMLTKEDGKHTMPHLF